MLKENYCSLNINHKLKFSVQQRPLILLDN